MRTRRLIIIASLTLVIILLMATAALAAVTTTVAEIQANPVEGQVVSLTGTITSTVEGNEFTFVDSTGNIIVDGGPWWFKQLTFTEGQEVTVVGEVDLGKPGSTGMAPEIDLYTVDSGGVITTVRPADGPPPWAGGPKNNPNHPGNTRSGSAEADDDADVGGNGRTK